MFVFGILLLMRFGRRISSGPPDTCKKVKVDSYQKCGIHFCCHQHYALFFLKFRVMIQNQLTGRSFPWDLNIYKCSEVEFSTCPLPDKKLITFPSWQATQKCWTGLSLVPNQIKLLFRNNCVDCYLLLQNTAAKSVLFLRQFCLSSSQC